MRRNVKLQLVIVPLLAVGVLAASSEAQIAQVSGVPGDGIPDIYYYAATVTAPNGETRPAGMLSLDTDGTDFVALLVSSPDLTGGCILCAGGMINGQTYTLGYANASTQWIRTNPLSGPGPIGIFDLTQVPGLGETDFPPIFDDQGLDSVALWSVIMATDAAVQYFTNVTVLGGPIAVDPASWGAIKSTYR